jgi:FixJ family two-component response regulator
MRNITDPAPGAAMSQILIAIVDDDKGARQALEMLVRSLGHNVSAFGSAEEFLKSQKLHDASCIIADLQMPCLSGLDLQDLLIAMGHRIPIIFITGHPDDSARARAMKAGAIGFLSKPLKESHLLACLETALKAA